MSNLIQATKLRQSQQDVFDERVKPNVCLESVKNAGVVTVKNKLHVYLSIACFFDSE